MFQSLRWRLGAIFVGFLLLVAASVTATFLVIQTQQADAAIINLAGRQRMLSQRMLWLALSYPDQLVLDQPVQLFDQTLQALRYGGSTLDTANRPIDLPSPPDAALRTQLDDVADTWSLFREQLAAPRSIELQAASTRLIDQLDQVVYAYETRAQAKLTRLQIFQAIFLIAAVALLGGGYYVVRAQLLQPLSALGIATQRMAQGDLSQPVAVTHHDELGELAQAFDTMRSEIAAAHDELETRVEQRTQELTTAFEFSQEISAQTEIDQLLQSVTDRARALTHGTAASLCTVDRDPNLLTLVAASGAGPTLLHLQQALDCDPAQQVVGEGATVVVDAGCTNCRFLCTHAPGRSAVAPLRTGSTTLGALCVVRRQAEDFDANETRALTLLANSAAVAIANARLVEQQTQQAEQAAIAAERDRLAADLHDNLAQTLSFLNLKSDRVREMVGDQQLEHASDELAQMKQAIGTAYQQVRAALTGLREPAPDADNLRTRLNECVAEFSASSDLTVELNIMDASAIALPRVTQAQAYHIVREALANTRRHAQAQHVAVTVSRANGRACFVIEDDGRGFERASVDEQQHLGLNIMRLRAERCGGSLQVKSELGQGTTITALLPVREGESH
ncbi:MAG: type IV pili methyl-accepting chemotaxis transducer N-terminal domain-containing protein [Thermoflexales bacterium]|nr:type IV pili methyl-accepting chemotaxis transducer N-terminal domain-containing protein [Thermoflexales bacterium]